MHAEACIGIRELPRLVRPARIQKLTHRRYAGRVRMPALRVRRLGFTGHDRAGWLITMLMILETGKSAYRSNDSVGADRRPAAITAPLAGNGQISKRHPCECDGRKENEFPDRLPFLYLVIRTATSSCLSRRTATAGRDEWSKSTPAPGT